LFLVFWYKINGQTWQYNSSPTYFSVSGTTVLSGTSNNSDWETAWVSAANGCMGLDFTITVNSGNGNLVIGIIPITNTSCYSQSNAVNIIGNNCNGYGYNSGAFKQCCMEDYLTYSFSSYGTNWATASSSARAVYSGGSLTFYVNGVSQGIAYSGLSGNFYGAVSFYEGAAQPTITATLTSYTCTPPTASPTSVPTFVPSNSPSLFPTDTPTQVPSKNPTKVPSNLPTHEPTNVPTSVPTKNPTGVPSYEPTLIPSTYPTSLPTSVPTSNPSLSPTFVPSAAAKTTINAFGTSSAVFYLIIVVVIIIGLLLIMLIIYVIIKRNRRKKQTQPGNHSTELTKNFDPQIGHIMNTPRPTNGDVALMVVIKDPSTITNNRTEDILPDIATPNGHSGSDQNNDENN